jgi:hypothetical protein
MPGRHAKASFAWHPHDVTQGSDWSGVERNEGHPPLYMYPYEDHGPAARETILDLWARWVAWLEKYLKG